MSSYTSYKLPTILPDGSVWTTATSDEGGLPRLARLLFNGNDLVYFETLHCPSDPAAALAGMYRLVESAKDCLKPDLRWATVDDLTSHLVPSGDTSYGVTDYFTTGEISKVLKGQHK